jgi:hypothetical protein
MVAIIAGGGVAGLLQGATTALRAKSSLFTGGIGNPAVSTLELIGSSVTAILAIVLPIIGIILVIAFIVFVLIKVGRSFFKKMKASN